MLSKISNVALVDAIENLNVDSYGWLWRNSCKHSAKNVMILSDPLVVQDTDPYQNSTLLTGGALHIAYRTIDGYCARLQAPDIQRLLKYLSDVLFTIHSHKVIVVTYNDQKSISPDPWIFQFDQESLRADEEFRRLFRSLNIRMNERCALAGNIPDDVSTILAIARWFWTRHGRNLYLFLGSETKIMICHEKDIHLCSTNSSFIRNACRKATTEGLFIAPFDLEQCP